MSTINMSTIISLKSFFLWEPGLLKRELSQNAWIYGPASPEVLFHVLIEQRWGAAAALLGIDTNKISDEIGHA